MIEVALAAGIAAFAVTTAVVHGEALAWFRACGTWAGRQRWWFYYPLMPARASKCELCFSFWAALPFAALASALTNWWFLPIAWFGGAGVSALLTAITDRLYVPRYESLQDAVQMSLLNDEKETEPPEPFTSEAYNQMEDEDP